MRGLVMALLALDFPGHDGKLRANHLAGRTIASPRITKTTAKTTKTTGKTV